jgi:hypothetical protein
MRLLVTHSLLSSWQWALKENPYEDMTTERDPFQDFLRVLNREPTDVTPAMQKGIDFEQLVTDIMFGLADTKHPWYEAASKVFKIVRKGSLLQYSAKKNVTIGGRDFLLYGRLDALRAGVVYDIKYSSNYRRGMFINGTQHPMYLELIPQALEFSYVISNGREVWTETYTREDTPSIIPVIEDFLKWLEGMNLVSIYEEKWQAR